MKVLRFALGALLASGMALSAQEGTSRYEVGFNYSWLHASSNLDNRERTGNGGSGYLEYNLSPVVGLVADFGGYANTKTGINETLMTYMFGPRFNWRHSRLTPYAQFLFGGGYLWSSPAGNHTSQNAFATAAGGGLDYALNHRVSLKPIQVEYVMTQINSTRGFGSRQNDIRYSAGVVLRFGSLQ